jgi:hypothetical protein
MNEFLFSIMVGLLLLLMILITVALSFGTVCSMLDINTKPISNHINKWIKDKFDERV